MNKKIQIVLNSLAETEKLAKILATIASRLSSSVFFCLFGDLGTGKTQFVKFFGKHLGIKANITSPSFQKMEIYPLEHNEKLVHIDYYHLLHGSQKDQITKENQKQIAGKKFFQIFKYPLFNDYLGERYVLIEWPELLVDFLKGFHLFQLFWAYHNDTKKRVVKIEFSSEFENSSDVKGAVEELCQEEKLVIV